MATQTLTQGQVDASTATAVPIEGLAGGTPPSPAILALHFDQRTGWAVRNRDGTIASGVHEFRPGRIEGGGMIWLRFRAWQRQMTEPALEALVPDPVTAGQTRNWGASGAGDAAHPASRRIPQSPPLRAGAEPMDGEDAR